ncbi:MAG: ATP-binding protein, partial [Bacteroidota bacterium]
LDMEKRKNFYLIFKEAVNNAIKYSGAAKLKVNITQQNSQLELLVKDNGVGFNVEKEMKEPSQTLSGNGLKNMYARAKEMNAVLNIKSSPNDGTAVQLIFPLS